MGNQKLKFNLINELEWEDKCKWCGIIPEYNGKYLTLQLDHINGNNKDNRIENLRILCPNCHTQTKTYGMGNLKENIVNINEINDKDFLISIRNNKSLTKLSQFYGYKNSTTKFKNMVKYRLMKLNIDNPYKELKIKHFYKKLENILIDNIKIYSTDLKQRLINELEWEDKCKWCGIMSEYNGKYLTLQLDHINGNNKDNRIENLRILCPNCHTQTKTHCIVKSYNVIKKYKKFEDVIDILPLFKEFYKQTNNICNICNINKVIEKSKLPGIEYRCSQCCNILRRKVKIRPSKEELLKQLEIDTFVNVGKKYGVSDNCIRKWLK